METQVDEPTDETDAPVTLAELAAAIRAWERTSAVLALTAARLDRQGFWAFDGSTSMTAWLRHHCRMAPDDAGLLLRRGRFLDRFEAVATAAITGRLSAAQTNTIRHNVRKVIEPIFEEHQRAVVEALAPLDHEQTVLACAAWRQKAEALLETEPPPEPERSLTMGRLPGGTGTGRFTLPADAMRQLERAITTATTHEGADDTRTAPARRADALADIAAFFNANHARPGSPRHRPHLELVHDTRTSAVPAAPPHSAVGAPPVWTARTIDHEPVDLWCSETLACDCVIHRVLKAGSTVLDYGRAVRSVPISLFRAVALRDGGCRYPGCNRKIAWCDAHHLKHWVKHGETKLENLALLCSRHHHQVHREQWDLQLLPTGELRFTAPDGRLRTSWPRGTPTTIPLVV